VSIFIEIFVVSFEKRILKQSAKWPFRVIQGHWFRYSRKCVCKFLSTVTCFTPFQRYCRFSAEKSGPTPIPSELWVFPLDSWTRWPMLSPRCEDLVILGLPWQRRSPQGRDHQWAWHATARRRGPPGPRVNKVKTTRSEATCRLVVLNAHCNNFFVVHQAIYSIFTLAHVAIRGGFPGEDRQTTVELSKTAIISTFARYFFRSFKDKANIII